MWAEATVILKQLMLLSCDTRLGHTKATKHHSTHYSERFVVVVQFAAFKLQEMTHGAIR